jgi:hypothetical protein
LKGDVNVGTGCGRQYDYVASKLPRFLENWLTDGAVRLSVLRADQLAFTLTKIIGTEQWRLLGYYAVWLL